MIINNRKISVNKIEIDCRFNIISAVVNLHYVIVCYDYDLCEWRNNIECFDLTGNSIWITNGRNLDDWNGAINPFVEVRTYKEKILAFTFNGTRYFIDFYTGKLNSIPWKHDLI